MDSFLLRNFIEKKEIFNYGIFEVCKSKDSLDSQASCAWRFPANSECGLDGSQPSAWPIRFAAVSVPCGKRRRIQLGAFSSGGRERRRNHAHNLLQIPEIA